MFPDPFVKLEVETLCLEILGIDDIGNYCFGNVYIF